MRSCARQGWRGLAPSTCGVLPVTIPRCRINSRAEPSALKSPPGSVPPVARKPHVPVITELTDEDGESGWYNPLEDLAKKLDARNEALDNEIMELQKTPEWIEYDLDLSKRIYMLEQAWLDDPEPPTAENAKRLSAAITATVKELQLQYRSKYIARLQFEKSERERLERRQQQRASLPRFKRRLHSLGLEMRLRQQALVEYEDDEPDSVAVPLASRSTADQSPRLAMPWPPAEEQQQQQQQQQEYQQQKQEQEQEQKQEQKDPRALLEEHDQARPFLRKRPRFFPGGPVRSRKRAMERIEAIVADHASRSIAAACAELKDDELEDPLMQVVRQINSQMPPTAPPAKAAPASARGPAEEGLLTSPGAPSWNKLNAMLASAGLSPEDAAAPWYINRQAAAAAANEEEEEDDDDDDEDLTDGGAVNLVQELESLCFSALQESASLANASLAAKPAVDASSGNASAAIKQPLNTGQGKNKERDLMQMLAAFDEKLGRKATKL